MGGIDEAALERLQLIVEMTKHIQVRASKGTSTSTSASASSQVSLMHPCVVHSHPCIANLIERCSDGVGDQAAEDAFQAVRDSTTSVLGRAVSQAVSRARSSPFSGWNHTRKQVSRL
jgi:hypothetical protein